MNARVILINIVVLVLLVAGAITGFYFYNQNQNYVSTDNAKVDGQQITISAPAAGQLTVWSGRVGSTYHSGDRIGTVQTTTAGGTAAVDIIFPQDATIVQQNAVERTFVAPGMPLARAYDLNNLWITANIEETRINEVKAGQAVDVDLDAFPGTTLTGKVDQIGLATASTFSLLPSGNATSNYTKVTQVIPIVISLNGYKGLNLVPGMNASIRIHI